MTARQKVLIFGGGLIGGAAALNLSQAGVPVTVITRVPAPQHLEGIVWRFGAISNQWDDLLFADCQALVYAAGSMTPGSSFSSVAQVLADQVVPVVMLAEQAARNGVQNFVFISSGGTVYGRTTVVPTDENVCTSPINAYGMVKVQTEQALLEVARRSTMNVIILRVSNPYGPAQQGTRSIGFVAAAIEAAQRNTFINIWGDGLNQRDFIYLDDVAQAILLAVRFQQGSAVLNIGSGRATSLLDICDLVEKLSGRQISIKYDRSREVDVRCNMLDVTQASAILAWRPQVSLEAGITKTLSAKRMLK